MHVLGAVGQVLRGAWTTLVDVRVAVIVDRLHNCRGHERPRLAIPHVERSRNFQQHANSSFRSTILTLVALILIVALAIAGA